MRLFLALVLLLVAAPAVAQGWGDLDRLLRTLAPGRYMESGGYWLPDTADPLTAREAIGVVYPVISGAAGNTEIRVGYFTRQASGWVLTVRIDNVFGLRPREVAFLPDRIELTTTTLGPNDPRCCPTGESRWSIDRATLAVSKLR